MNSVWRHSANNYSKQPNCKYENISLYDILTEEVKRTKNYIGSFKTNENKRRLYNVKGSSGLKWLAKKSRHHQDIEKLVAKHPHIIGTHTCLHMYRQ